MLPTSPTEPADPVTRWARAEAAKCEVALVATVLRVKGIAIMPLKGVELVTRYGREATERYFLDADILIEPHRFSRVIQSFRNSGFRQTRSGWSACTLVSSLGLMALDIHRLLLPPFMGKLSPERVFERGRSDPATYGVEIVRMDPC